MKKNLCLFSLLILLFSCSSPEDKAKKAIKEELRLTLHDFKSYEPLDYDSLKPANSSYEDLPEVKIYNDKADIFLKLCDEYNDNLKIYDPEYFRSEYEKYMKMSNMALDSAGFYIDKVEAIKKSFVSKFIGWKMVHSFRSKNLSGNYAFGIYEFYFDKEITKATKSINLSEILNF